MFYRSKGNYRESDQVFEMGVLKSLTRDHSPGKNITHFCTQNYVKSSYQNFRPKPSEPKSRHFLNKTVSR